jgi:hypothetical protein
MRHCSKNQTWTQRGGLMDLWREVPLERAADCGRITAHSEVIHLSGKPTHWKNLKPGVSPRIRDLRSQSSQGSERCLASPCWQHRTKSPVSLHIDPLTSTESSARCCWYHPDRLAPAWVSFHRWSCLSPRRPRPSGARPMRDPCPHSNPAETCG